MPRNLSWIDEEKLKDLLGDLVDEEEVVSDDPVKAGEEIRRAVNLGRARFFGDEEPTPLAKSKSVLLTTGPVLETSLDLDEIEGALNFTAIGTSSFAIKEESEAPAPLTDSTDDLAFVLDKIRENDLPKIDTALPVDTRIEQLIDWALGQSGLDSAIVVDDEAMLLGERGGHELEATSVHGLAQGENGFAEFDDANSYSLVLWVAPTSGAKLLLALHGSSRSSVDVERLQHGLATFFPSGSMPDALVWEQPMNDLEEGLRQLAESAPKLARLFVADRGGRVTALCDQDPTPRHEAAALAKTLTSAANATRFLGGGNAWVTVEYESAPLIGVGLGDGSIVGFAFDPRTPMGIARWHVRRNLDAIIQLQEAAAAPAYAAQSNELPAIADELSVDDIAFADMASSSKEVYDDDGVPAPPEASEEFASFANLGNDDTHVEMPHISSAQPPPLPPDMTMDEPLVSADAFADDDDGVFAESIPSADVVVDDSIDDSLREVEELGELFDAAAGPLAVVEASPIAPIDEAPPMVEAPMVEAPMVEAPPIDEAPPTVEVARPAMQPGSGVIIATPGNVATSSPGSGISAASSASAIATPSPTPELTNDALSAEEDLMVSSDEAPLDTDPISDEDESIHEASTVPNLERPPTKADEFAQLRKWTEEQPVLLWRVALKSGVSAQKLRDPDALSESEGMAVRAAVAAVAESTAK